MNQRNAPARADAAQAYLTSEKPAKLRAARRMARGATAHGPAAETVPATSAPAPVRGPSKIDQVLALLRREEGATLAELMETTGWLPHTTRAALTGLRKKGHVLAKDKRGEVTCYRVAEPA